MDSSLSVKQTQSVNFTDSYPKFIRIVKTKENVHTRSNIPVGLPSTIEAITPFQLLNRPITSQTITLSSTDTTFEQIVDISYVWDLLAKYSTATYFRFRDSYLCARITVRFIMEWSESPAYVGKHLVFTRPSLYTRLFADPQNNINIALAQQATIITPSKASSLIIDIPVHSPLGSVPMKLNSASVGGESFVSSLNSWVSEVLVVLTQNTISTNSTIKTFPVNIRTLISEFVPIYPRRTKD